jgi:hypothetical protein
MLCLLIVCLDGEMRQSAAIMHQIWKKDTGNNLVPPLIHQLLAKIDIVPGPAFGIILRISVIGMAASCFFIIEAVIAKITKAFGEFARMGRMDAVI